MPSLYIIDFSFFSSERLGEVYLYDLTLLRHIVMNLLLNSIKYSSEEGVIDFKLHVNEDKVEICISDNGIGIPEENQHNIFEAFIRGNNIGTISGTGLGLSIVKNSVELHGGRITFQSKPGEGTRFNIELPFQKEFEIAS